MKKLKAVQYGCGPIGCSVVRTVAQRSDMVMVGAIDKDPALVGKDLGVVAETGGNLNVAVSDNAAAVLKETAPDVVFLTTSSAFQKIYPQLEQCLEAGANVVSSCEELSYPYWAEPALSADLDRLARTAGATVIGTGVNPGFVMDTWPLVMSGVCQKVQHVRVARVQNASSRRCPFQQKIGAGCTLEKFKELAATGVLRHVGLTESIAMIAAGLGWQLDDITDRIEPVVAQTAIETNCVMVAAGQVAGVRQLGRGTWQGRELIALDFVAAVGNPESYDAVYLTGEPDLEVTIKGGTHGDIATAAMMVNTARRAVEAPAGLLTMKDLPVVSGPGV
jgi:2,4-diaminopentanoate dehydrogenase